MGFVDQVTIKVLEDVRRAGITPDVIKKARQEQAVQRQIELIGGPGVLHVLQRYKEIIDRHTIPPHVGTSGPRAKAPIVIDASSSALEGKGSNAGGGDGASSDDDGGGGDGDSDGPRRHTPVISAKRSPSASRSSSHAVRRKLNSSNSPVVIMHARALVTLVLISVLCLVGALSFAIFGYEKLALACLGLPALHGWTLASKLVEPK
ncbi:hypothetical protein [Massilia oculi]|uniref:hypothetical protein n=1 Tax=Massilia oculi TaxID=945844 RepID=UPI001AAFDBB0|nr:hypothetical protein [Massilia oculi]